MTAHFRHRGLLAAYANTSSAAILAGLNDAFAEFKQKHGGEVSDLMAAIDALNADIAALKVGGAGGDLEDANPIAMREAKAALGSFVRTGKFEALNAAMRSGSDPDGGYTVDRVLSDQIKTVQKDISPMARLARRVELGSGDVFEEPIDPSDIGASWVGETGARTETDTATLKMMSVTLHESYTNQPVTQRLLDDSHFDIAGWLNGKIITKFSQLDGAAFVAGDGVSKPRGILAYDVATTDDDTRDWGTLQYVPTGAAANFTASNPADVLVDLVYKLRAPYRANARWLMNRKTAGTIRKFKDGQGQYLWTERLAEGQAPLLLGFPVELDEEMPDIGANAFPVAFGDFMAGYIIVDRPGIRLLRDPYTSKPNVLFYAYRRVGGAVQNSEAIKLLKVAAT